MGIPQAAPARSPRRRSDAGQVRLQQRDLDGLLLLADHYAAPYDLLAQALDAPPGRVRAITARWRAAGYAQTGVLGPGSAWCWLTPAGMTATGYPWPARAPALSRLAHVRAVLAARLWLQDSPVWRQGNAWWRSERRVRAALPPPRVGVGIALLPWNGQALTRVNVPCTVSGSFAVVRPVRSRAGPGQTLMTATRSALPRSGSSVSRVMSSGSLVSSRAGRG